MQDEDLIALVREARPHLEGSAPDSESWLSRLEERHDELHRLVEERLAAGRPEALELAAALWPYWWQRGHMGEARVLLERAVAVEGPDRARALRGLGTIAFRQGDVDAAERAFVDRLGLVEREGTELELVEALTDLSRIALRRGDFAGVRTYAERAYEIAVRLEEDALRMPLHMRAAAARMEGRLEEARALYLENRELSERLGYELMVVAEDHNLFHVALRSGDREEAERRFRASSEWILASNNAYMVPYAYLDAGVLALHDGDLERAGRLVACADRIFEESGSIPDPDDAVELEQAVARLRRELGERFDTVWAEGRKLGDDEAQALART